MAKTIEEINEKIRNGTAVVLNAEEIIGYVGENGVKKAARDIDVVTTATFGPMCSSGAFFNFGHSDPPIRMTKVWLNDVPAYAGIAAVDAYLGATELSESLTNYGGAHVIQDLVEKKPVKLKAISYGTDCYPRREINTFINLESINQAYLFNPRNAYQNYAAAVNSSNKTIFTYMGKLMPNLGNITYSTSSQISPLLNDPYLRTIGIGTRIFLAGAEGYVAWQGTQHNPCRERLSNGTPNGAAGTIAVIGDLKKMNSRYLKAAVFYRYGVSLYVGIGIPIPVLDEEMIDFLKVRDEDILTHIFDYSVQRRNKPSYGTVNYKQLRSGSLILKGKKIPTGSLSSYQMALEIADILKEKIKCKKFFLTNMVAPLPADERQNVLNGLTENEL
jgi:uncharacterized protein (DUF39 family)